MTPASTTTIMWLPRARELMSSTKSTVNRENPNAKRDVVKELTPRRMATAAPNAAPWLAPKMSGETSGFWKMPW